jgi:sortase A
MKRKLRLAEYIFAALGIVALGYCVAAYFRARLFQSTETRKLEKIEKALPPKGAVGPAPAPREGAVVGRLAIPRLGLSVIVVEGVQARDLEKAAGHIPGTALPGEPGNVGIAAHRDTFFRPLRAIRPNDAITLSTFAGSYRYRVVSTEVVFPSDIHVLDPTGQDALTLVTCFPFNYIGAAPKRFIVRADRT